MNAYRARLALFGIIVYECTVVAGRRDPVHPQRAAEFNAVVAVESRAVEFGRRAGVPRNGAAVAGSVVVFERGTVIAVLRAGVQQDRAALARVAAECAVVLEHAVFGGYIRIGGSADRPAGAVVHRVADNFGSHEFDLARRHAHANRTAVKLAGVVIDFAVGKIDFAAGVDQYRAAAPLRFVAVELYRLGLKHAAGENVGGVLAVVVHRSVFKRDLRAAVRLKAGGAAVEFEIGQFDNAFFEIRVVVAYRHQPRALRVFDGDVLSPKRYTRSVDVETVETKILHRYVFNGNVGVVLQQQQTEIHMLEPAVGNFDFAADCGAARIEAEVHIVHINPFEAYIGSEPPSYAVGAYVVYLDIAVFVGPLV